MAPCVAATRRHGQRHGRGMELLRNGEKYDGDWRKNQKHGAATYRWPNGRWREGLWTEDKLLKWMTEERDADRFALSTRGFYRVLKVARTLADLAGLEWPDIPQYQEALSYRSAINPK